MNILNRFSVFQITLLSVFSLKNFTVNFSNMLFLKPILEGIVLSKAYE